MGCVASKQAVPVKPTIDNAGTFVENPSEMFASSQRNQSGQSRGDNRNYKQAGARKETGELRRVNSHGASLVNWVPKNLPKYAEGEQIAAGWPAWLSAVAGDAIQGWVPMKSESFQKLEKIGQGTYSSVYRASHVHTGQIVALKKVRFDNYDPESVRFMAREIQMLRQLDHPNIVKLEGLIASKLSSSIYLVFEYMEHDLTGLSTCPDISFSESQVKCYMRQLLLGLDYCHSHGIMHRDIKGSNLLLNNEGFLKIADFGLANFCIPWTKQPLTSRVVTLWYRPPELLLGCTDYGPSVDLWSVGCVFAELLLGKPILQGRTEVEQLHKIFKLCGSPTEEYWKKSKVSHATVFRPQHPYESCLREMGKNFPRSALKLIETLLSVEPSKRGTASAALNSEYFITKPYACAPSTLPKYPPNKEIDAKAREEAHRKRASDNDQNFVDALRPARPRRRSHEVEPGVSSSQGIPNNPRLSEQEESIDASQCDRRDLQDDNAPEGASHVKHVSLGSIPFSGPLVPSSNGFAWVKKRRDVNPALRTCGRTSSRGPLSGADMSNAEKIALSSFGTGTEYKKDDTYELDKHARFKHWTSLKCPGSFNGSDLDHSQEFLHRLYQVDQIPTMVYNNSREMVEFSGPLLPQSNKVNKMLQRNERHIRQAVKRSWFMRGKKTAEMISPNS